MSKLKLSVTFLTLFPEMFPGPLGYSLAGKALKSGIWSFGAINLRDFATDRHATVDDTPYGGGAGMVLRPDVIDAAIRHAKRRHPNAQLIYFTPRGMPLTQALAHELLIRPSDADGPDTSFILLCGRYEGIDERIVEAHQPLEISLGDYVLSGGEIAALVFLDAVIRLLPGVMGKTASQEEESFALATDFAGLLEYPHYTKPPIWNGLAVPEVLLSGNHAVIRAWRLREAEQATRNRRPDLWNIRKGPEQ